MIWRQLLYPDVFDYSIDDRVEVLLVVLQYDLTDAELDDLMVYAKPGTAPTSAPTPAESPAPIAGVLAGLAAAAVVAGVRRHR